MDKITTDLRFSIIPESVLDADITDRAVRIYALLARYADNDTGKCFPSRETLAKRARCHVRSVGRAIDELVGIGAIEKHHRKDGDGFTSNLYVVKRVVTGTPEGRAQLPEGRAPTPEGSDTTVPLTRTNELEPKNDNHLTKPKPKNADEYQPSEEFLQKLTVDFPGIRLDIELEKFRDHHVANGSQFKIWDRAFRKWVRQASEWSRDARAARSQAVEDEKIRKMIEEGLE